MDFNNLKLVEVPQVTSAWSTEDLLGAIKVRSSIGRNMYKVTAGLYKMGKPTSESEVIVTSNYKLSFDIVRRHLQGMDCWILVLETHGVNVWCAAGKGTFGTDELIQQIKDNSLSTYVTHKRIIVPQLGAPGISGYKVKKSTGFTVNFGPVRAQDIKTYISNGLKKTDEQKTVKFTWKDRLLLTPVEIVNSLKYLLFALLTVVLLSGITNKGYSFDEMWHKGIQSSIILLVAYFSGAFLGPVFLPYLLFRSFGGKGLIIGVVAYGLLMLSPMFDIEMPETIAWLLISASIASFLTMNFTGASTYTSLSGVQKEMKIFIPIQIVLALTGLVLIIISKFV